MSKLLDFGVSSNIMEVKSSDNPIENASSMNGKLYFLFRTVMLRSQG